MRSVIDALEKEKRIAQLYALWYEQREEVIRTYTETLPPRVPLSENTEFKSVRNAVIRAAMTLVNGELPEAADEGMELPEEEPTDAEVEKKYLPDFRTTWGLYGWAKRLLDTMSAEYAPKRAADMLTLCAKRGNTVAKYRLGKMYLRGDEIGRDTGAAIRLLTEAADEGNVYAECLLGKTYLRGEDVLRDAEKAEYYLRRSAERGNKYAAYTLGKALLDGDVLQQDIPGAVRFLKASADQGFCPAQYVLGRMYYRGEPVGKDLQKASDYLELVADQNANAAYLMGKICLAEENRDVGWAIRYFRFAAENGNAYAEYQLGRLYFFGKDTERDEERGKAYLRASAAHGNEYAAKLLESIHEQANFFAAAATARLFQDVLRLLITKHDGETDSRLARTDKKLLRKIDEKKQAQGLKQE